MTTIFSDRPQTRIFGIAPGRDFSHDLVAGLLARHAGTSPDVLARTTILTNTQRAARRLETVFAQTGPCLLPRIRVITDLARDPLLADPAPTSDEPPIATHLRLTQLVRRLLETDTGLAPPVAAFDLAASLAELMDEMAGADIPANAFDTLKVDTASRHWQTALQFLRLITQLWPDARNGPDARQIQAVRNLAIRWAENPPRDPVILAGSTGSRAPTRELMSAVLALPQGALLLPGFDHTLGPESWAVLTDPTTADHPQFGFAALANALGFDPNQVAHWHAPEPPTARAQLLSLALRPAPVTHEWRRAGPALAPQLPQAFAGLDILTAPNERAEAAAIAAALRAGLDTGQSVALITPDGTLSRRVTAQLARWDILPDESAGQPLHLTPEGVFLGLLLDWSHTPDPVTLTALLKHPLTASQGDRSAHLALTRRLDATYLRDCGPVVDWPALQSWATEDDKLWTSWLEAALTQTCQATTLADHVARHRQLAEALCADPYATAAPTPNPFWTTDLGAALDRILSQLTDVTDAAGPVSGRDYRAIFDRLTSAEKRRSDSPTVDQRVLIWGQLEARVQSADLIILGGLNEGTWPAQPPPDPWLSRDMRAALNLASPERRIGLAAHDFQQSASGARVIMSRASRLDNTPTVPSRWLVRLENLVNGLGAQAQSEWTSACQRGETLLAQADALDAPDSNQTAAPRPAPVPPMAARPTRIYVTHAETLVRDPYAYYARHILNLRELPRAGRLPDPRDRGNALHATLEKFVADTLTGLPNDADAAFVRALDWTMENKVPWPAERRLWHARLARLATDFIRAEQARRQIAQPQGLETKGVVRIPGFARNLELAAKADRIDVASDGGVAIYDYKSSIPTDKQSKAFAVQLPLEAKMVTMGGFLDKLAHHAVALELIGLSKPGEVHGYSTDMEGINRIWDNFLRLIAHYEDPASAYPSRLRVHKNRDDGDYDHLARRGEWADGDDFDPEVLP